MEKLLETPTSRSSSPVRGGGIRQEVGTITMPDGSIRRVFAVVLDADGNPIQDPKRCVLDQRNITPAMHVFQQLINEIEKVIAKADDAGTYESLEDNEPEAFDGDEAEKWEEFKQILFAEHGQGGRTLRTEHSLDAPSNPALRRRDFGGAPPGKPRGLDEGRAAPSESLYSRASTSTPSSSGRGVERTELPPPASTFRAPLKTSFGWVQPKKRDLDEESAPEELKPLLASSKKGAFPPG